MPRADFVAILGSLARDMQVLEMRELIQPGALPVPCRCPAQFSFRCPAGALPVPCWRQAFVLSCKRQPFLLSNASRSASIAFRRILHAESSWRILRRTCAKHGGNSRNSPAVWCKRDICGSLQLAITLRKSS